MTAASTTKSVQHRLEKLVLGTPVATGETTLPVKNILTYVGATANPADTTIFTATGQAGTTPSPLVSASFTATGVAVGDVVMGWGVVSGLATSQVPVCAYVSATDTILVWFAAAVTGASPGGATVTTTAATMNFIVADVT